LLTFQCSIGKLWDLLRHYDKKGMVDFNENCFFDKQFCNGVSANDNCVVFAQIMQHFSCRADWGVYHT